MSSQTQHGYLFLADISGYTSYLSGVELDHAHEILTGLLDVILSQIKPVLTIAKLEGDAVFAYAAETSVARGETLLELIEATYAAFRRQRDAAHRNTTCECNACRSIPMLDLKFFLHHGDYVIQTVHTIRELVGSDVNLAHRLMKNHVTEATGWKAYALLTKASLAHIGLSPEALGMQEQFETYEHLGEVKAYTFDLQPSYEAMREARRVVVTAEEADVVLTRTFDAPPPVLWEWLNDPRKRSQWMSGHNWSVGLRPSGRTGPGARNHCVHGKDEVIETVLDWRPFEYVTTEQPSHNMVETVVLESVGNGTRVETRIRVNMPLPTVLRRPAVKHILHNVANYKTEAQFDKLAELVREEAAKA